MNERDRDEQRIGKGERVQQGVYMCGRECVNYFVRDREEEKEG